MLGTNIEVSYQDNSIMNFIVNPSTISVTQPEDTTLNVQIPSTMESNIVITLNVTVGIYGR